MNCIFILLFILFFTNIDATSCSIGRGGCVASCIAQNCATGYCQNGICVCTRCDKGPSPIWKR